MYTASSSKEDDRLYRQCVISSHSSTHTTAASNLN